MWLTDLADIARDAGLPVKEVDGWQLRGHGPLAGVRAVICHHTAGPATGDMPSLDVIVKGRPGLEGPLCNLGLSRNGTVYVVAAGMAWHAGVVVSPTTQGNEWTIGIEAEATGLTTWPTVQYDAYVRLCRALIDHYGLSPDRVLGHKEVASPQGRKTDPNFDMQDFRAALTGAATAGDDMTPDEHAALLEIRDALRASGLGKGRLPGRSKGFANQSDDAFGWLLTAAGVADTTLAELRALAAQVQHPQLDYAELAAELIHQLKQ
jgi:hypothetical protein